MFGLLPSLKSGHLNRLRLLLATSKPSSRQPSIILKISRHMRLFSVEWTVVMVFNWLPPKNNLSVSAHSEICCCSSSNQD